MFFRRPLFLAPLLAGLAAIASAANLDHAHIKWAFQTDGPVRGSATLAGDRIVFGSADGNVYAVAKADGALLWKHPTGGAIAGAPAVSGNTVVVAGRGESVLGLNLADGSVRWSFQMQPTLPTTKAWNYFTAPPVIDGNRVLIGSGDGNLYALDLATGALRWKFATEDSIRAAPLVAGDTIYLASCDDRLYALAADNGTLQWQFATDGVNYDLSQGFIRSDIFTRPILADGAILIAARDGKVYSIDTATHEKRWDFSYGSTWAMSTAVTDGAVFVGWSTNNKVNAIDLATGEKRWEADLPAHTYSSAVEFDGRIYWASADGVLRAFDPATGQIAWSYDLGSDLYSAPVHDSDTLYLGTDDGRLVALTGGHATPAKALYLPNDTPAGLSGFIIDPALAPGLAERGYSRLESPAALVDWIKRHSGPDAAPSVVVFGFATIPVELMGEDPAAGPMRAYLESGGKVVWPWGMANKYTFDAQGNFSAYNPTMAADLLEVRFIGFEDGGNYYTRATQTGRNWGLPAWLKTSWASLEPESRADVTPLAIDEYGRVSAFLKSFHSRPGSGWVSLCPVGYGIPIREAEIEVLDRVASYGLD